MAPPSCAASGEVMLMAPFDMDAIQVGRRTFVRAVGGAGIGFALLGRLPGGATRMLAALPGGDLDPATIAKFAAPLLVPPVMPRAGTFRSGETIGDYYEISVRQFRQQILPAGLPPTAVWGYGPIGSPRGMPPHNAPSPTIEARWRRPVRVKWVNDLVTRTGHYLPHLLPVDPTLHWANPPGGKAGRDSRPSFDKTPGPYRGPVPIVTHLHGAVSVGDDSDGYAEAWYLPDATDIPADHARHGTWYDLFAGKARDRYGVRWTPGSATFQYPNPDRARTQWYHDHALGLTRANVYAGPAGFYLLRGGPGDVVRDSRTGRPARLPGPAPREGDNPHGKRYREIPIVVQDRAFNADGSLFYPDSRKFFDGVVEDYVPEGEFPPIWNPEFFGNTMMVNGRTWPYFSVEKRRYRLRFLNGCQSRFLILDFSHIPGVKVWQIGNDGGFLPAPVNLTAPHRNRLLMALAERADLIVDFSGVPIGAHVLRNVGPDEPFGGGEPDHDFDRADPATTGQVMQFRVVPAYGADTTTPPRHLVLPRPGPLPAVDRSRRLALIEIADKGRDEDSEEVEGPVAAMLGVVKTSGLTAERAWSDPLSENPAVGDTEVWEIYNTTVDAHPVHLHEVVFEVVNRQALALDAQGQVVQPIRLDGPKLPPERWETGVKDTVTAYPGQVTRLRMHFEHAGQFVWHCHVLEHEDNEMMRPYRIGPRQPGQPG